MQEEDCAENRLAARNWIEAHPEDRDRLEAMATTGLTVEIMRFSVRHESHWSRVLFQALEALDAAQVQCAQIPTKHIPPQGLTAENEDHEETPCKVSNQSYRGNRRRGSGARSCGRTRSAVPVRGGGFRRGKPRGAGPLHGPRVAFRSHDQAVACVSDGTPARAGGGGAGARLDRRRDAPAARGRRAGTGRPARGGGGNSLRGEGGYGRIWLAPEVHRRLEPARSVHTKIASRSRVSRGLAGGQAHGAPQGCHRGPAERRQIVALQLALRPPDRHRRSHRGRHPRPRRLAGADRRRTASRGSSSWSIPAASAWSIATT